MQAHSDISTLVQIATWFIGALQVLGIFIFGFLFSRIKDASAAAKHGDDDVRRDMQQRFTSFEATVREQRVRLDDTRDTMLTKTEWRDDLRELRETISASSLSATEARQELFEKVSGMRESAVRVEGRSEQLTVQMANMVETQAELTTSVERLTRELDRIYPLGDLGLLAQTALKR